MNEDPKIQALKSALASSHDWTGYATLIILAGILLEIIILFFFAHDMSPGEKIALFVANALIAVGLGLEFVYGGRGADAAAELQQISDQKVAALTVEARNLELTIAKLKTPRKLKDEHKADFIKQLKQFAGTTFDLAESDPEAMEFALIVGVFLREAGWNWVGWTLASQGETVQTFPHFPSMGKIPNRGVVFWIYDPKLSDAMKAVVRVLEASGIEGIVALPKKDPPHKAAEMVMHVMIGTKPL